MPKPTTTNEELDETLFGGFKFMDQGVTKDTNKSKSEGNKDDNSEKAKAAAIKIAEAEVKALEEARLAAEARDKKKAATENVEEEEEEEESDDSEGSKEDETSVSALQVFAKELSGKGLLELEETDKIETDEDLYKAYERTISKGIAKDRERLPKDAQEFLEFIDNGGNPQDFHKYYYATEGGSFEEFKIESEEDQEHVVREGLALEGYSEEEIEDQITDLKDLNKLEKRAETHLKKLQKAEKDQKKLLLEAQKENFKKQEEAKQKSWAEFKKGLFEKEEISGFKFNDRMKNDTWDYMTKIVDKKSGLTQYQIDSSSNPDARYMFAYLLKNKWDIKALEKQVTTKAVSKIASKLNNYSDTRSKVTRGTSAKENTDNINPFGGFKTIL